MSSTQRRTLALAVAAASLLVAAPRASAVLSLSYNFVHDGFADGATVSGSFAGVDLDNDGLLIHFPGGGPLGVNTLELTSFSMHFSGNSHSPAFDLGLADLWGFIYEINSPGLGDGNAFEPSLNQNLLEGVAAIGQAHFYTAGKGPNANFVGGYIGGAINFPSNVNFAASAADTSTRVAQVTTVPEPATPLLALAAAALVPALRRRKS